MQITKVAFSSNKIQLKKQPNQKPQNNNYKQTQTNLSKYYNNIAFGMPIFNNPDDLIKIKYKSEIKSFQDKIKTTIAFSLTSPVEVEKNFQEIAEFEKKEKIPKNKLLKEVLLMSDSDNEIILFKAIQKQIPEHIKAILDASKKANCEKDILTYSSHREKASKKVIDINIDNITSLLHKAVTDYCTKEETSKTDALKVLKANRKLFTKDDYKNLSSQIKKAKDKQSPSIKTSIQHTPRHIGDSSFG